MLGLCLFLESIEHDFIKALMIHAGEEVSGKVAGVTSLDTSIV